MMWTKNMTVNLAFFKSDNHWLHLKISDFWSYCLFTPSKNKSGLSSIILWTIIQVFWSLGSCCVRNTPKLKKSYPPVNSQWKMAFILIWFSHNVIRIDMFGEWSIKLILWVANGVIPHVNPWITLYSRELE